MVIDSHLHFFDAPRPGSQFTHVRDHLSYDDIRTAAAEVGIDRFVQVTPAAVGYDNGFSFAIAEAAREELGPPGSKITGALLNFVFKRLLPYPNRLRIASSPQ